MEKYREEEDLTKAHVRGRRERRIYSLKNVRNSRRGETGKEKWILREKGIVALSRRWKRKSVLMKEQEKCTREQEQEKAKQTDKTKELEKRRKKKYF